MKLDFENLHVPDEDGFGAYKWRNIFALLSVPSFRKLSRTLDIPRTDWSFLSRLSRNNLINIQRVIDEHPKDFVKKATEVVRKAFAAFERKLGFNVAQAILRLAAVTGEARRLNFAWAILMTRAERAESLPTNIIKKIRPLAYRYLSSRPIEKFEAHIERKWDPSLLLPDLSMGDLVNEANDLITTIGVSQLWNNIENTWSMSDQELLLDWARAEAQEMGFDESILPLKPPVT